jgi:DNA-binding SARP family transcriptional activator
MEIRVLGPFEVRDGDRIVELGGGKQSALLADLAIHRGEPLAADRLIDDLWGEHPPATAAKTLQALVSRLRRALGRDAIVTTGGGYVLGDAISTDSERLEALLRDDAAADALALFRGRPLADFAYDDFAQSEMARLEELRLTALEQRVEHDLAAGRHAQLVPELEALVREHPLRERLRGQLMLALYRSGRQADALDAYQSARTTLVDELGIEPRPELRELHQAILRQDPSLAPAPAVPQAAEPPLRAFVGRERELGELVSALDRAHAGVGSIFLVTGEPGIGKSRLAEELAWQARTRGARVLVGRSWEAGGAPAYWPWVEALRTYVRNIDREALKADLGADASQLVQIVPELSELIPDLPLAEAGDSESARFRLFDAVRSFLRNASARAPIVLVLDDLHAADEPSLLLLRFVARDLADVHVLVVALYRDVDPTPRDALAELLAEVTREPATRRVALVGLSEAAVAEYVALSATELASPELVAVLHDETEGNPLFVTETVRLLAVEKTASEGRISIPQSVRDVIARRLRHLSDETNRVLVLASVLGREFTLATLARVADVPEDALLDSLDEASAARVVSDVPDAPGRLRFAHVLIRDTLYDALGAARRGALHRRVVSALEGVYGTDAGPHLAELAHHAIAANELAKGVDYARRAGDHALSLLAYEEAARLYRVALEALESTSPADGAARSRLLIALGEAHARGGTAELAKASFLAAAELAKTLGLTRELARAAVGYGGRIIWARAGDDIHLVPLLESALAALPHDEVELRVRLLARLAGALRDEPSPARRQALSAEAVELARSIGDAQVLALALDGRSACIEETPDQLDELLRLADELLSLATRSGDRERVVHANFDRAHVQFERGDAADAHASLDAAVAVAEELRQPTQLWLVTAARATAALAEGRFDEARQLANRAFTAGERAQPRDARAVRTLQEYTLAELVASVADVEPMLHDAAREHPTRPIFRCALAHVYADTAREDEARVLFRDLAADDFATLPRDTEWICSASVLAQTCAALRDAHAAATLHRLMLPFEALNVANVPEMIRGATTRYLAILAGVLGDEEESERRFRQALAMNRSLGARPWLALTQAEHARTLLERGNTRDARDLLSAAIATFDELGMRTHAARAAALQSSIEIVGPSPSGS